VRAKRYPFEVILHPLDFHCFPATKLRIGLISSTSRSEKPFNQLKVIKASDPTKSRDSSISLAAQPVQKIAHKTEEMGHFRRRSRSNK